MYFFAIWGTMAFFFNFKTYEFVTKFDAQNEYIFGSIIAIISRLEKKIATVPKILSNHNKVNSQQVVKRYKIVHTVFSLS